MLDHINMHSSSQSHLKREKLEAQSKHSKTLMLQLLLLLANLVCTSNHSQAGSVHHHRTKPWPSTDQEVNRSSLLHHPYHRQMQSKCPTTPNQLAILSRLRQADENSDQVLGHSTMITPQDDLSALWLSPRSLSLSHRFKRASQWGWCVRGRKDRRSRLDLKSLSVMYGGHFAGLHAGGNSHESALTRKCREAQ